MLRIYAESYIQLGAKIFDTRNLFNTFSIQVGDEWIGKSPEQAAQERDLKLRAVLEELKILCEQVYLSVSAKLIGEKIQDLPQSERELDVLIHAVVTELNTRLFLFVSPPTAGYYERDDIVSDTAKDNFPDASAEIRAAATCLALDQYTASVFHSMRAAEIGVRALADEAQLKLKHSIDYADWQEIQSGIRNKIEEIGKTPRSKKRDEDLEFYSQAGAQLQFSKDGWRVRVMHSRSSYSQIQAHEVLEHVRAFFNSISTRLSEPL